MSEVKRVARWQVVRSGAGSKGLELGVYEGDNCISGGWVKLGVVNSADDLRAAFDNLSASCEAALKPTESGESA